MNIDLAVRLKQVSPIFMTGVGIIISTTTVFLALTSPYKINIPTFRLEYNTTFFSLSRKNNAEKTAFNDGKINLTIIRDYYKIVMMS